MIFHQFLHFTPVKCKEWKRVCPDAPSSLNSSHHKSNPSIRYYIGWIAFYKRKFDFINRAAVKVLLLVNKWMILNPKINTTINASQKAVNSVSTDPELHIILVTSDDDPSPSRAATPIRPCRCKLRIESAMMRAVFFWYPPDVTIRMGIPRRLAALNTISSLLTMPWQTETRESCHVSLTTAAESICKF